MEERRTDRYMWRAQPATLHRLKVYCARHDFAINAVVDEAVSRYLDENETKAIPPIPPNIRPARKSAAERRKIRSRKGLKKRSSSLS